MGLALLEARWPEFESRMRLGKMLAGSHVGGLQQEVAQLVFGSSLLETV